MDLGPPGSLTSTVTGPVTIVCQVGSMAHAGHIDRLDDHQRRSTRPGNFFSQLSTLSWGSLLLGLALYAIYLLLRSRALFNAVRAAYPGVEVRWRDVWGAYMVGYGVNTVFPLGGGNIAQLFLTRISIPPSSYPTVATALWTGVIFDWFMGLLVMCFAFTQGVFPKPPDFSKLPAFDISFFASHHALHAVLRDRAGDRVPGRVRAAVGDACGRSGSACARASRSCATAAATGGRCAAGSSPAGSSGLRLLLGAARRVPHRRLGAQRAAGARPCRWSRRCSRSRPGGLGVQQALLLTIFAGSPDVAAFSVGQQIATAVLSALLGFAALVLIFRFKSFREVIQRGKEHRRRGGGRRPCGLPDARERRGGSRGLIPRLAPVRVTSISRRTNTDPPVIFCTLA